MTTQTTHLVPALLCTIWAILAPLIGFVAGYICGATKKRQLQISYTARQHDADDKAR